MSRPVIAVFGATGTQGPASFSVIWERRLTLFTTGSAVVDTLLSDGTFTPRAITRNTASDKALALKTRGAEVAQANIWDKESIIEAITGCEGVFGVRRVPFIAIR
jgi:NmrA-like family